MGNKFIELKDAVLRIKPELGVTLSDILDEIVKTEKLDNFPNPRSHIITAGENATFYPHRITHLSEDLFSHLLKNRLIETIHISLPTQIPTPIAWKTNPVVLETVI